MPTLRPPRAPKLPALKRNKYNARKTEYKGIMYDSAAEAKQAWELDVMKDNKLIMSWERQVRFPLRVNGHLICNFVVDFRVVESVRRRYLLETKGVETGIFKMKLKLFRALYPDEALHVVKV